MLPQFRNAYSKPVVLREWTSSHGPVASGLPDTKVYQLLANLLEMHILRPHPTLTELETLEVGSRILCLIRSPGNFGPCSSLRTIEVNGLWIYEPWFPKECYTNP